jgi:FdrA protein
VLKDVHSNIHPDEAMRLADHHVSQGHTLVDLGDDTFTQGRPHPMIDPSTRVERMQAELDDDQVAVWLLDCVLGHGSCDDPAGAIAPLVAQAVERGVVVVASITGTSADPQGYAAQRQALAQAGAVVCESNAQAARLVAGVIS